MRRGTKKERRKKQIEKPALENRHLAITLSLIGGRWVSINSRLVCGIKKENGGQKSSLQISGKKQTKKERPRSEEPNKKSAEGPGGRGKRTRTTTPEISTLRKLKRSERPPCVFSPEKVDCTIQKATLCHQMNRWEKKRSERKGQQRDGEGRRNSGGHAAENRPKSF